MTDLDPRDEALADLADRIVHVARRLTARANANPAVTRLSTLEAMALRHVDQHPGIASSQLAADLELRTSNASTVLGSLVDRGFLHRANDPDDRRAAHFTLTDEARHSVALVRADWSARLREHVPDSADLDALRDLLDTIGEAL